jgi:hypothetical protein
LSLPLFLFSEEELLLFFVLVPEVEEDAAEGKGAREGEHADGAGRFLKKRVFFRFFVFFV